MVTVWRCGGWEQVKRTRPVGSSVIGTVQVSMAKLFEEQRHMEGRRRFRVSSFRPVRTERRLQSSRSTEVVGELQVEVVLGFAFDIDDADSGSGGNGLAAGAGTHAAIEGGARSLDIPPAPNMTTWAFKQGQFRKQWKRRCVKSTGNGLSPPARVTPLPLSRRAIHGHFSLPQCPCLTCNPGGLS